MLFEIIIKLIRVLMTVLASLLLLYLYHMLRLLGSFVCLESGALIIAVSFIDSVFEARTF